MLLTLTLLSLPCLAQAPASSDGGTSLDAPKTEPAPVVMPQPDPDPNEFAERAGERVGLLQGKLEALEEQFVEAKNDILSFKKIKISGYVQGRYSYLDASTPVSKFQVRRGRLKVEYLSTWARFMVQPDFTTDGVVVRDAEATLIEGFSGKSIVMITVGQTKWPFGYECVQSSVDREFPERSNVVRAFLPAERDRGIRMNVKYGVLRAAVGVFDGNGIQHTGFLGKDNDNEKDVLGRIGADFRWIAFGLSGWTGLTLKPADAMTAAHFVPRNRLGGDVQVYLDLLPFGGTALKAEFIGGTSYQASGVEKAGVHAMGGYFLLVQNILAHEQIGFRYDYWDPDTDAKTGADAMDATKTLSTNPIHTLGFIATHHFDENLKVSLVYELPIVEAPPGAVGPKNNLFTLQLQARF